MYVVEEQKKIFIEEVSRLHARCELAKTVGPDYYEPGMMEYLEQYDGFQEEDPHLWTLRFEVKGTRYEGRTEQIEYSRLGDPIQILRESENPYNYNNFTFLTRNGRNVGNMPAELCNAIAPLYDNQHLFFRDAHISFVEPISKCSRYAKQAILFIEMKIQLLV